MIQNILIIKNIGSAYLHKVVVDEIDDLQMSWQDVSNHIGGPSLKSLRQDGVVGVGTATVGDVPSLKKTFSLF